MKLPTSLSTPLLILFGLGLGVAISEGRRAVLPDVAVPTVEIAPAPVEPVPQVSTQPPERKLPNVVERRRLANKVIERLEAKKLTDEERARLILELGDIGTDAAINWLVAHYDITIHQTDDHPDPRRLPTHPSLVALSRIGDGAIPKVIEAYLALPGDRWPEGLLRVLESSPRAAYVYAQGYLFANKEDGHRRDAVVTLIKELGRQLQFGDLPYPPPWFGEQPGLKKP